jgi:hypothetical protein
VSINFYIQQLCQYQLLFTLVNPVILITVLTCLLIYFSSLNRTHLHLFNKPFLFIFFFSLFLFFSSIHKNFTLKFFIYFSMTQSLKNNNYNVISPQIASESWDFNECSELPAKKQMCRPIFLFHNCVKTSFFLH